MVGDGQGRDTSTPLPLAPVSLCLSFSFPLSSSWSHSERLPATHAYLRAGIDSSHLLVHTSFTEVFDLSQWTFFSAPPVTVESTEHIELSAPCHHVPSRSEVLSSCWWRCSMLLNLAPFLSRLFPSSFSVHPLIAKDPTDSTCNIKHDPYVPPTSVHT
jgi:hypothetical protein